MQFAWHVAVMSVYYIGRQGALRPFATRAPCSGLLFISYLKHKHLFCACIISHFDQLSLSTGSGKSFVGRSSRYLQVRSLRQIDRIRDSIITSLHQRHSSFLMLSTSGAVTAAVVIGLLISTVLYGAGLGCLYRHSTRYWSPTKASSSRARSTTQKLVPCMFKRDPT